MTKEYFLNSKVDISTKTVGNLSHKTGHVIFPLKCVHPKFFKSEIIFLLKLQLVH
jgi:hypothetical protein